MRNEMVDCEDSPLFEMLNREDMRTLWLTLVLLVLADSSFGQGEVNFANSPSTRLTTNDFQGHSGFTTGVNAYRIGLYIAPQGTTDPNAFTLMGPTTINQSGGPMSLLDGLFNGNPCCTPFVVSNYIGQTIAFQIRAWSLFAGNTAEEAQSYNGPETVYYGRSAIGFALTTASPTENPSNLFGTHPGQVGGFTLTPIIPEPSTWALVVLGAGALWCGARARRGKSRPPSPRVPQ